jgi:predicted O-methyltransferase YrrM
VLLDQLGDAKGADEMLASLGSTDYLGARDSWQYIKSKRSPQTRIFSSTRETLLAGLEWARPDGSVMEFGVRLGISTRWLAAHVKTTVHGFDSFEGLPEQWDILTKGAYSTHGEIPELPNNVQVHVGWFDATLPRFVAENADPVRFANVDCDLYSSTKVVLDQLADRIGPGTVLVFDEYLINDQWRQDEYKAFQEAVASHGWRYEYLAFRITD